MAVHPRKFLHVTSQDNRALIESYCQVCHKFIQDLTRSPGAAVANVVTIAYSFACILRCWFPHHKEM